MSAGDFVIRDRNWIRGPAIIATDDFYIDCDRNDVQSTVLSMLTAGTQNANRMRIYGERNTISGRVIGQSLRVSEERNLIHYEGGVPVAGVSEQFVWMDSTW